MKAIPDFPNFVGITAFMHNELYPFLNNLEDGISEFTFLNLYLHQKKYAYKISKLQPQTYVLTGSDKHGSFFCIIGGLPEKEQVCELLEKYTRWKHISQRVYDSCIDCFTEMGYIPEQDPDSADYLYLRENLATLAGKSLHKKRNFANSFEKSYDWDIKPLDETTAADAGNVLDLWQEARSDNDGSDYDQCTIALSLLLVTNLEGIVVYADGKPVGWAMGEYISAGKTFVVHFEKGIDEYRGVYQFVNRATARSLSDTVLYINREQDLGDEGLRQAKMTYRPVGFVKKYWIKKHNKES
ncbi:MAG: DUF2156 domain-containing protein [Spirochaetales bacterium]